MPNPVKSLDIAKSLQKPIDISIVTIQIVPGLLKALAILSDTTMRRSAVDWEDLKPYWKWKKKTHFSLFKNPIIYKFI